MTLLAIPALAAASKAAYVVLVRPNIGEITLDTLTAATTPTKGMKENNTDVAPTAVAATIAFMQRSI